MQLTSITIVALFLILSGCSTSQSMKNRYLGRTVSMPEPVTHEALLTLEKQHADSMRYSTFETYRKDFHDIGQFVFTATRTPYVLAFAQQQASNRADWKQVAETTMDLANMGMHLFSGGATLAPLWVTLVDVDRQIMNKSKERKMMRMPSLTIYVPHPDLDDMPLDEALAEGSRRLGERLVATGLCRYHTYPRLGAYGLVIPGILHRRTIMCGKPNPDVPTAAEFGNAIIETVPVSEKNLLSRLFGKGAVVSTFYWVPEWTNYAWEIQQDFHDYAWQGPEFVSALEGFRTLKSAMPDNAYAVITGPDHEGKWQVFVGHQNLLVKYEPPWTREFKRAKLQAQQARKELNL